MRANTRLVLACQQGFPAEQVQVVSASLLQQLDISGAFDTNYSQKVLCVVTTTSVLCIDTELARLTLLAPMCDVAKVHVFATGVALDLRGGQMWVLCGDVQSIFGFGSRAIGALAAAGVAVEHQEPGCVAALLDAGAKQNAQVRDANQAAEECLNILPAATCLGLSKSTARLILAAYQQVLSVTGSAGLSAAAFAHLTGTNIDSPLLHMIWKQHGMNAATSRLQSIPRGAGRALQFTSVCGGDMPSPGDQIEFDKVDLPGGRESDQAHIGPLAFIALIAILIGRAPKEVQMLWLFSVLDSDHDGTISFHEVRFMLSCAAQDLGLSTTNADIDYTTNLLIAKFNVFSVEAPLPPKLQTAPAPPHLHFPGKETPPLSTATGMRKSTTPTTETLDPNEFRLFVYGLLSDELSGGKLLQGQICLELPLDASPLHQIAALAAERAPKMVKHTTGYNVCRQSWCQTVAVWASALLRAAARHNVAAAWGGGVVVMALGVLLQSLHTAAMWPRTMPTVAMGVTLGRCAADLLSFFAGLVLCSRARGAWAYIQGTPAQPFVPTRYVRHAQIVMFCAFAAASVVHAVAFISVFVQTPRLHKTTLEQLLQLPPGSWTDSPSARQMLFGTWIGISGFVLVLLVLLSASFLLASHLRFTLAARRAAHTIFLVAMVGILFHSSQGRPRFWRYILLPACVLCADQLLEARSAQAPTPVASARCIPNCNAVELTLHRDEDFDFKSGAFVQIKAPDIGSYSWHPFTILSAPQENQVRLLIKSKGEFTECLCAAVRRAEAAGLPGQLCFPQGVLLRGPCSPQTAHWPKAHQVVLIGQGMGVLPMLAAARDFSLRLESRRTGAYHRRFVTRAMHLCWLADSEADVRWLQSQIPDTHAARGCLRVRIAITGPAVTPAALPLQEWLPSLMGMDPAVARVQFTRPAAATMLSEAFSGGTQPGDRCSVFVCGPAALVAEASAAADQIRKAASSAAMCQLQLSTHTMK